MGMPAAAHTRDLTRHTFTYRMHAHTTPATCARLLHEQKSARTSALHLRRPSLQQLRPPHVQLWPARRPPRADTRTDRCTLYARSPSPPRRSIRRERPHGCRRCRRCRRALGSAPTMAAAADKEHVRLERETPISAPAGSRMAGSRMAERRPRAPSGAAREAGWRRADMGRSVAVSLPAQRTRYSLPLPRPVLRCPRSFSTL